MNKKVVEYDERTILQINKYGFQALLVMTGLLVIDLLYKILILQKGFGECWDIYLMTVIPWFYYEIRAALSGAIIIKSRKTKLAGVIGGIVFLALVGIPIVISMSRDSFFKEIGNNSESLAGIAVGLILVAVLVWIISRLSKKASSKDIE